MLDLQQFINTFSYLSPPIAHITQRNKTVIFAIEAGPLKALQQSFISAMNISDNKRSHI